MNWVDVKGYEGLYQVSDTGLVRSLDRVVTQKNRDGYADITRVYKGRTLKPKLDRDYLRINLNSQKKGSKFFTIHRLVALHFCDGWFEGAVVNHIDGDKTNNNSYNLEWVTIAENNIHAYNTGLKDACLKTGESATRSQWIISIFKDGSHLIDVCGIEEFNEFGKPLGLKYNSMLNYFRGTVKQYKGYTFTRRLKNERDQLASC